MSLLAILIIVFAVSVLISLALAGRLTRVVINGRAEEHSRQWSKSDTPRIGGIAVFAATPISVLAVVFAVPAKGPAGYLPELAGALIASAGILFFVGLLDDL